MTLTVVYAFEQLLALALPTHNGDINDLASNSDTIAMAGGGLATIADNSDGLSDMTIFSMTGSVVGSPGVLAMADSKMVQTGDGNVIVVGNHIGGGVDYVTITPSGGIYNGFAISTDTRDSNADVSALGGGNGKVVVYQRAYSATDHDIRVYSFNPSITSYVQIFTVDISTANDQNPSVAALTGGGYAVAWERIDASGNSTGWVAVYNADSTVRSAPRQFDGFGTIAHQLDVTALATGGFAICYEDDITNLSSSGGQTDITVAVFNANGSQTSFFQAASTLASADTQAACTTLSNGMALTSFTNAYDAGHGPDNRILATLFDPVTGLALTDAANPQSLDLGDDMDTESSISTQALAQFAVSYSSGLTGEVRMNTFQLVRTVTGDAADDTFTGDDAVDIVSGLGGADNFHGGANDDTLDGGSGSDFLDGGSGNDTLLGGANNDYLVGGDGKDLLNGGTGADAMLGGLGNDTYVVDNINDEVYESSAIATEIDRVQSTVGFSLGINVEKLTLIGAAAIDGTGNSLANTISGNAAANVLKGLGGRDTLIGGAGGDVLDGGSGVDTASYSGAKTGVVANLSNTAANTGDAAGDTYISIENLSGSSLNDKLFGNNNANRIIGAAGDDVIRGNLGNDVLWGQAGEDTFIFNTALNAATNVDRIKDFAVVDDTIRVDSAIFGALGATGWLSADAFAANATGLAGDASDRIIFETDTGKLFYDADGTGVIASVQFATLSVGLALTAADFYIV